MNQIMHTPLTPESRDRVGSIFNRTLADEFALSSAARDYHWNVSGPHFRSLNDLFDEQYHQLDQWIERIAERARSLGIAARTGWTELIQAPRFKPAAGTTLTAARMMEALIEMHGSMAESLRQDAAECSNQDGASATSEFLRELIEYHETSAWMLGEMLDDRVRAQA